MQQQNSRNFGRRLRWLRTASGFQGELGANRLAAALDIATSTLYAWEKREHAPSGDTVMKLAKALGITESKLLGLSGDEAEFRVEEETSQPFGSSRRSKNVLRRECESHVRTYLDAAMKIPDGLVIAHYNLIRRLPLTDFDPVEKAPPLQALSTPPPDLSRPQPIIHPPGDEHLRRDRPQVG